MKSEIVYWMQEQDKKEMSDIVQATVTDPILLFTNVEAFKKYTEERDRIKEEAETDIMDLRSRLQRIHDEEMAKRVSSPPPLTDEYIAAFHANQNSRRGPTIGVDSGKELEIQSKEELARMQPLRRTGVKMPGVDTWL